MDDPTSLPPIFANRVIRQFADHMLGPETEISEEDFRTIRVVFRYCGGSWVALMGGAIQQLTLLERIITLWGQQDAA